MYESNIQQKFFFMYMTTAGGKVFKSDKAANKHLDNVTKFRLSFSDIRVDSYVSNFNILSDSYFSLTRIIKYRSRIESMYVK